jgi:membrane fusion protein (multidrug efflux system)
MRLALALRLNLRAASALAPVLLLCGCGGKEKPERPPAEVGVVTLTTGPVTVSTELPARTNAYQVSQVRPQVAGIVKARLFTEGTIVHAGQPLYQIDPSLYRASRDQAAANVANAQAALTTAQAKADRYKTLSGTEAISRQDADDVSAAARQANAAVQQARATLQTARINLDFTRIVAPITGRIGRSSVTPGALVTASQTDALATIQQLDPIYVDITQSSSQLLSLRRALASGSLLPASATVQLKLEDGSLYPQSGTIEFAEPIVDVDSGTITIRARFPNPNGLLLPGMFVRVVAPQAVMPNAILVPQQGITRDAKGDATALLIGKDNKVVMRSVTADRAIGDKWLITAGLKAGDRLIVEGTGKAMPGAAVRPVAATLGK